MMIDALRKLLRSTIDPGSGRSEQPADDVELATAALLVEMARADFVEESAEFDLIDRLLRERFDLSPDGVAALVERATARADRAVSLQEFTRLLHEQLDADEKVAIVEMLWRLSLADGRIDKHEEHLVRKVAGLLYVPDRDLIGTKLKVTRAQCAAEAGVGDGER